MHMKFFSTLLLSLLLSLTLFAQDVAEETRDMSKGSQPCFTINLPQTETKTVKKMWTKFIKEYKGKTKKEKSSGKIFSDDAKIRAMSDNTVDVYAAVNANGSDNELVVWYDLGGAFLSTTAYPDKAPVAVQMLKEFSVSVSVAIIQQELKEEEKSLKSLNDDLEDAEKDKTKLEKDIADCEQSILEAKESIKGNDEEQKILKSKIEAQQKVVQEVKSKMEKIN